MTQKNILAALIAILVFVWLSPAVMAEDGLEINTGVDMYNRYVWRGLDIAATPSVQPSFSLNASGFEFGIWGAYTLSNQASEADEIDFWLGYTFQLDNGASIRALATDYYFPNAGIDFFNFNNYDATYDNGDPNPGAHTLELGLSFTGAESFPVTLAGYMNIHNDAGNNIYLQADYPFNVNGTELNLFCGVAAGSEDNPDYYGTDDLQVINLGVSTSRDLRVSETLTIPLNVAFTINPNAEISYLLVGISL